MTRAFFRFVVLPSFVIGTMLLLYGLFVEPRRLVLRHLDVGDGNREIKLAVLTDIHVGGMHMPPERVARIVEAVNAEDPDVVLIPGDFINGHTPRAEMSFEALLLLDEGLSNLSGFRAPVVATTGNHDSWFDRPYLIALLRDAGFNMIDNDVMTLSDVCFVGIADHFTDQPTDEGFSKCGEGTPVVALMHSPDSRHLVPQRTSLAVAGHTHGGQVNLPVIGRAVTSTQCGRACAYGWIHDNPPIYVSAGLGTSILPIRFRSPPEIVLITLRWSDAEAQSD